jgi:D-tyrosyl-tRNA(Tyr) deacylase
MRVVIQRVSEASIKTGSGHSDSIGLGLLILLGIEDSDNYEDISWLCKKIGNLRIFSDDNGVMNLSVKDVDGECMVVSQFTLHASTKKGNRPSYIRSAKPEIAIPLYERFIAEFEREHGIKCATGVFGDHMDIQLVNDGPVTIIIDTKNKE